MNTKQKEFKLTKEENTTFEFIQTFKHKDDKGIWHLNINGQTTEDEKLYSCWFSIDTPINEARTKFKERVLKTN